jgi:hypothetical protein
VHELLLWQAVLVSYTTLRRFVRRAGLGKASLSTLRVAEWPPGEVAEMDFGRLGLLVYAAGKRRPVWALVVVLLEAAWRFFRGVPRRLIPDRWPALRL